MKSSECNYYITYNQGVIFMNGIYEFFTKKFIRKAYVCVGLALIVFAVPTAFATEPNDSIGEFKQLDEIVVEGQNQRAKTGELSFIPTKRQKEIAHDGYDLLRHLAMTQISVDPVQNNVTTLTGDGVAIYINGIPASDKEVQALKTSDVLNVEYLESPADPRYDGKKHVINFNVKKSEQGGYTRASAEYQTSAFDVNAVYADLYSKFAYKSMVYDVFVGHYSGQGGHLYSDMTEHLSLLSTQGEVYSLDKTQTTTQSSSRDWTLPLTFRAIYHTDRIQIANTIELFFNQTKDNSHQGIIQLSSAPGSSFDFSNAEHDMYRGYTWYGFYTFDFGKGTKLMLHPLVSHSHLNGDKSYQTDVPNQDNILTDMRENAWNAILNARASKVFAERHSLSLGFRTDNRIHKTEYGGTSEGINDMKDLSIEANVGYSATFPFNLRLNAEVGFSHIKSISNETKNIKITPTASVDASYVPNERHQINLALSYSAIPPMGAFKTATVVQDDEWMYITGNPGLKPYSSFRSQLYYTWLPANNFYATVVFENQTEFNSTSQVYSHYNDGQALLRSYVSDGNFYAWTLGLNLTYKPVNQLQLQLKAAYKPATRTGMNEVSVHPIEGMLSAMYYMGQFYVGAFGMLSSDKILPMESAVINSPAVYGLTVGWGNKHWKVTLRGQNMFNSSWEAGNYNVEQPLYSKHQVNYNIQYHRGFMATVSYTFDYGKKVQHGDELQGGQSGPSAILK